MSEWIETLQRVPKEGVEVETRDSGGNVQTLVRKGGLWFFPDMSMYVYYTPTAWRAMS